MGTQTGYVYGGVEAGGTKWVCAVGNGPEDLKEIVQFPCTQPAETLEHAISFFKAQSERRSIRGIGIGCFGPLDLNPNSRTFGYITSTPKPGWANTDVAGTLERELGISTSIDTDVNAAALGEHYWGNARELDTFIYLTVGTGIGGGGLVNGKLMHGLVHPEMGHIRIPHDPQSDPYKGHCPFHGDCLEGLACGPAVAERWGQPADTLPDDHPAWDLEAHYLALGIHNLVCTLSPQRIILGGGVMRRPNLIGLIREQVLLLLNNYVDSSQILNDISADVVGAGLGQRAGVLGAIALARRSAPEIV